MKSEGFVDSTENKILSEDAQLLLSCIVYAADTAITYQDILNALNDEAFMALVVEPGAEEIQEVRAWVQKSIEDGARVL